MEIYDGQTVTYTWSPPVELCTVAGAPTHTGGNKMEKLFVKLYPNTEDYLLIQDIFQLGRLAYAVAVKDPAAMLQAAKDIEAVQKEDE